MAATEGARFDGRGKCTNLRFDKWFSADGTARRSLKFTLLWQRVVPGARSRVVPQFMDVAVYGDMAREFAEYSMRAIGPRVEVLGDLVADPKYAVDADGAVVLGSRGRPQTERTFWSVRAERIRLLDAPAGMGDEGREFLNVDVGSPAQIESVSDAYAAWVSDDDEKVTAADRK